MAQKKKIVKKATKAPAKKVAAPKVAPAAAAKASDCVCPPKRGVCWKKILIFILGLAIGAGACMLCKGCPRKRAMKHKAEHRHEMFVDGCFDLSRIRNPERLAQIQALDTNGDGCITKEEFFGSERPARPRGQGQGRGQGRGGNRPARQQ